MDVFTKALIRATCLCAICFMAFMAYVTYWNNISDLKRCMYVEGDKACFDKLEKQMIGIPPDWSLSRHPF